MLDIRVGDPHEKWEVRNDRCRRRDAETVEDTGAHVVTVEHLHRLARADSRLQLAGDLIDQGLVNLEPLWIEVLQALPRQSDRQGQERTESRTHHDRSS